jgi:methylthioribulose-1-phosphate dehydratase
MFKAVNLERAQSLWETIKFFAQKSWVPATSSNFSVRSTKNDEYIISRSGIDKSLIRLEDLILIDKNGEVLEPFNQPGVKSSAETMIHTKIYELFPQINSVLHTHSVIGTVLSMEFAKEGGVHFEGLEILKAFEGNSTHAMTEFLPIVKNSQDMNDILRDMEESFKKPIHGFLIAGHGLYTWGKDIPTAKRQIEAYEFMFECFDKMRGSSWRS